MHTSRLLLAALSVHVAVGCAPAVDEEVQAVDLRAEDPGAFDPALGFQLEGPEFRLEPGEEKMICWVPDFARDGDLRIAKFQGIQSEVGHHVVAMRSQRPREPGSSFDCTNIAQMAELAPLVLPDPAPGVSFLPEGFFIKLAAADSIVIQSHYVNYTTDPIIVRDFARFFVADDNADLVEASYLIVNRASFRIEPGTHSVTTACTIDADTNILATLGHMHEHGRSFRFDRLTPTAESLYSVDAWTTDMRDEPPVTTYDPATPLALHAGDELQVTCDYNNTTDHNVSFPEEMCTSVSAYFPARGGGLILCEQ
jgi:hypothetical protein